MPVDLPTGKRPGWELEVEDDDEPRSVLESCAVLQSLRQSRDAWMYSIFNKFSVSGRVRGKPEPNPPPPHTIQPRGRCQIEIGPHIFPETNFYEVQYLPPAPAATASLTQSSGRSYGGYTSYGNTPGPSQAPVAQHTTSPLLSSLSSVTAITPALINQVNAAAASNPTLANLLQFAAAGKASAEQLKTLGLLIQSLAVPESSEALSSAAHLMQSSAQAPVPAANTSVKDFDFVFSYHETSYERWILPRGPVICEKVADNRTADLAQYDMVLTLALEPPRAPQSQSSTAEVVDGDKPPLQVVTIRFKRPPPAIWETIWRWVGGEEKLNENRTILDNLKKQTNRAYLAHQLPQNSLLTQLQNAALPQYAMKSIKPGPIVVPRPKRKPQQRKPVAPTTPAGQAQAPPPASGSTAAASPATPSPAPTTTLAPPPARSSSAIPPEAKRRKIYKPNPTTPIVEIRCVSCQQKDVPLILGGRGSSKFWSILRFTYGLQVIVVPVFLLARRPLQCMYRINHRARGPGSSNHHGTTIQFIILSPPPPPPPPMLRR
ncbi:hypothetical protein DFH07DRAFT_745818 [Mycena maculata]|uniref:Uncharacterized protein n=1 Tax=Mycena maculata TaxID=230809 RepID=A0AAD7IVC1_9AGAR|nr:hypothetical protein DFH07DRAFT_745818 [Mycena maculata]